MSPKAAKPQAISPRSRGRPKTHREAWTKVSVVLFDRQVRILDTLAADIRAHTGAVLTRAELLRSFVDALYDSGLDISATESGAGLRQLLTRKLAQH